MRPIDILEDIFTNQISVLNIAVTTFVTNTVKARDLCTRNNYDVQLVRDGIGSELMLFEKSTGLTRHIADHEIISETTPILDAIDHLVKYSFAFVKEKRKITRIVTRADLDSVPVRIWLFGMLNLLEAELRERIKSTFVVWETSLSNDKFGVAKSVFQRKIDRNEEIELLDCVQFSDLSTIIISNWILFGDYSKIVSKIEFQERLEKIRGLRNEISHAQKLTFEWKDIFDLMTFARIIIDTEPKVEEV
jgi:hypothetical protein